MSGFGVAVGVGVAVGFLFGFAVGAGVAVIVVSGAVSGCGSSCTSPILFKVLDWKVRILSYQIWFLWEKAATAIPLSRASTGISYVYLPFASVPYGIQVEESAAAASSFVPRHR